MKTFAIRLPHKLQSIGSAAGAVTLALAISSCKNLPPVPGQQTTVDFDSLAQFVATPPSGTTAPLSANTQYPVGTIIQDQVSGFKLVVLPFQWQTPPQNTTYLGHVEVQSNPQPSGPNMAGGGMNSLHFNNACLGVIAPVGVNVSEVQLKFGDHGGNENLIVNGAPFNVDRFTALPKKLPGPVTCVVSATLPMGMLELKGVFKTFFYSFPPPLPSPPNPKPPVSSIPTDYEYFAVVGGGQELWIDDLVLTH